MRDEFLWTEKYRPRKVDDVILPDERKEAFKHWVETNNVPNLILTGTSGVGKTTIAKAMLDEMGADYIKINGSKERNIDTLRTVITDFATSVSLSGGRKYVIIDEADYLNPQSMQPALRSFMEDYSHNCGFIFTCNFTNRIIEPLQSRCTVITFDIPKEERDKMAHSFYKRILEILEKEEVTYSKDVLVKLVMKYFPDNRRTLNEIQKYAVRRGGIDEGVLAEVRDVSIDSLVKYMKSKNFTGVRKWVAENSDMDNTAIFRKLYDTSSEFLDKNNVPQLILIIAEYQYKAAFVVDQEINLTACLTEIMVNCEFK